MKKFSVVLLSMLLLFSITQAAFAQPNYLGVALGGVKNPSYEGENGSTLFSFGAKLNFNLSSKFSLNTKVFLARDPKEDVYLVQGQLDARYDILNLLMINAGLSIGSNLEYHSSSPNPAGIGLTAGLYLDVALFNSFTIYGDAKILLAQFSPALEWLPKTTPANVDEKGNIQFMGSIGLIYQVLPVVGINAEVGYQMGRTFFTIGAGLTF